MLAKIALMIIFAGLALSAFGQSVKKPHLPILNGAAIILPKPEYSQDLQDLCAGGKVEVQVLIGKDGRVNEARAVTGDELLYEIAVNAAKKARFRTVADGRPIEQAGIVVYDFTPKLKCIDVGVANKRATSIPRPVLSTSGLNLSETQIVKVLIIEQVETGDVLRAKAISGHPLLRVACERSALKTKFSAANVDGAYFRVRAYLTYEFLPDGRIIY